jgi:hypothetical protein
MTYKELYTQWVAINQAINVGALHETAGDEILQDMIVAYREENNLYDDGEAYGDDVVMDIMFDSPETKEVDKSNESCYIN